MSLPSVTLSPRAWSSFTSTLKTLGHARLGQVFAFHDRLVRPAAAGDVVGLDREHLLERVRRAIGLERPHFHLSEALAAELRLTGQRLLRNQAVGPDGASVDLVVHQVESFIM